ncbi:hypothetical protein ACFQ21_13265 [Ohtaekwangia kribbensis]|uniref:Cthe-2314-like HEPN domain-containing protein n=1 Tax=Ohtaekwangia kribbensis TaxID=688913 RepID=A0ABW3K4B5_9BACT
MEQIPSIFEEFYKRHDLVSYRMSWHEQHVIERALDLQGFIHSISGQLEEERIDYKKGIFPLGFFDIEQPTRIRYIKIIFTFTILERRSRALCKLIHELKRTDKTIEDYKGGLMDRLKFFIREYLDLDFEKLTDWSEIATFQKIRDCIIHCGGQVSESRDKLFIEALCVGKGDFEISENGYLFVNEEYVGKIEGYTIGFICSVLDELFFALNGVRKYPEQFPE